MDSKWTSADNLLSDTNACASGYDHSAYLQHHDINMKLLGKFPTDIEMEGAIKDGYTDAFSIMEALGYILSARFKLDDNILAVPSISKWYCDKDERFLNEDGHEEANWDMEHSAESESEDGTNDESEEHRHRNLKKDISSEAQSLNAAFAQAAQLPANDTILNTVFVATALDIECMDQM